MLHVRGLATSADTWLKAMELQIWSGKVCQPQTDVLTTQPLCCYLGTANVHILHTFVHRLPILSQVCLAFLNLSLPQTFISLVVCCAHVTEPIYKNLLNFGIT